MRSKKRPRCLVNFKNVTFIKVQMEIRFLGFRGKVKDMDAATIDYLLKTFGT